jgi:hypothetical protein
MIRILFIIITGFTLWFGGKAAYELWGYFRLDTSAPAEIKGWDIKEAGSSRFFVTADYKFTIQGKCFEGKTIFKQPVFLSRLCAEGEKNKWATYPYRVWYDSSNPRASSLQKIFPFKSMMYGLLTLGVLIYFSYRVFRAST